MKTKVIPSSELSTRSLRASDYVDPKEQAIGNIAGALEARDAITAELLEMHEKGNPLIGRGASIHNAEGNWIGGLPGVWTGFAERAFRFRDGQQAQAFIMRHPVLADCGCEVHVWAPAVSAPPKRQSVAQRKSEVRAEILQSLTVTYQPGSGVYASTERGLHKLTLEELTSLSIMIDTALWCARDEGRKED